MPDNISIVYNDFRLSFENTPDFVIDYYQKNAVFLDNIKSFRDKEDLRLFIEMTCKYVEAIYQKNRFNQAIELADKFKSLIDREIERLKSADLKDGWYQSFQFVKAMSSYRLYDYKTATSLFKDLTNIDPANDLYRNWLKHSLNGKKLRIVNFLTMFFVALAVVEIFFKSYIPNFYLRQFLLGFGCIGLIGSLLYESYLKRSLRNKT